MTFSLLLKASQMVFWGFGTPISSKISRFSRKFNGRIPLSFPLSGASLAALESLNSLESLENGFF